MRLNYIIARYLLVTGAAFVPFTSLRVGPLGVGEVALFGAFMILVFQNRGQLSLLANPAPLVYFWGAYIPWILIGFTFNEVLFEIRPSALNLVGFDLLAYILVGALVMVMADRRIYDGTTPTAVFERVILCWATAFCILFVVRQFTPVIVGLPLESNGHFSPFVDNLHQAAMLTCAMPFMMLYLAGRTPRLSRRILYVALAALLAMMAYESGATKARLAMAAGLVAALACRIVIPRPAQSDRDWRLWPVLLALLALLPLVPLQWPSIVDSAIAWITEEDQGSTRATLYTNGLVLLVESPIFGFGPGPHLEFDGAPIDAHSTMLTALLQGGLPAGIGLVAVALVVARRTLASPFLFGTLAAISVYFLGGDLLRRQPIWILVIALLYFCGVSRNTRLIDDASVAPRS